MIDAAFEQARTFIVTNGRLLERRLFRVLFEGGDPSEVIRAVAAHRNADGGLGYALEPDLRCSESQPLFCEIGLIALKDAGARSQELAVGICDFLAGIADSDGFVAPILPSALTAPRAGHWTERALAPALNPTASLCGLLHAQGASHRWLDRATDACVERALSEPPSEAHELMCVARLADDHPDASVRARLRELVAGALPGAGFFAADAPVTEYGLTPLHFAPAADSPWVSMFTESQIAGHLDDLIASRDADGGWPIRWEPPGQAAEWEWRARWTLDAIRTLVSFGRVSATP